TDRCNARAEIVPAEATIHVRRDTPPLYGLGLVERIPDDKILKFVDPLDQNHDGISGRANFVNGRVGRFGWKAQVVSLRDFAGADALDQLGLTSPAFPAESKPQGGQVTCDLVGDPEDKGTSVQAMADFVTFLAPLPADPKTTQIGVGRRLFRRMKCNACHGDKLKTAVDGVPALSRKKMKALFSDLLLHDMGDQLADGIVEGEASGREFRTPPLWGLAE